MSLHVQRGNVATDAEFAATASSMIGGIVAPPLSSRRAASATIAACTDGDGAGHVAEAQRGVLKSPPRRWLQGISFGSDGSISWPRRRLTIKLTDGVGSAAPGAVSELDLFEAYLIQANTLMIQLLREPPVASSMMPDATAVVLSPEGQSLRWFALASSTPRDPADGSSINSGCWDMLQGITTLSSTVSALDESAWGGIECVDLLLHPDSTALSILSRPTAALTPDEAAAWDGSFASDSTVAETSDDPDLVAGKASHGAPVPVSASKSKSSAPVVKSKARVGGGMFRSPSASEAPATTPISPLRAIPSESGASGESRSDIIEPLIDTEKAGLESQGVAGALTPPPTPVYSGGGTLPAEHVAVRRRAQAGLAVLPAPPPKLLRSLNRGMGLGLHQFSMIRDGDRVLVGLSGGKDSLTMLVLLLGLQVRGHRLGPFTFTTGSRPPLPHTHQARAPVRFDLGAVTVDPQYPGYDPSPLKAFCAGLGVPYFYESHALIDQASRSSRRGVGVYAAVGGGCSCYSRSCHHFARWGCRLLFTWTGPRCRFARGVAA